MGAFHSCSGIVDLDLPGGLQAIEADAFHACTGLETLVPPSSLASAGDGSNYFGGSFSGCTRLALVLVPD